MNKYNYLEAITNDIECWMDKDGDPFDISQFENRDEAAEFLNDELWDEDSITGIGVNYYDTEYQCEEYLCHNLDILLEAINKLDILSAHLQLRSYINNHKIARYLDSIIRSYLLPKAINKALEVWENYGYKYEGGN